MGIFSAILGDNQAQQGLADASAGIGQAYTQASSLLNPYVSAGQNALTQYQNATGQGNSAQGLSDFQNSPIYQLLQNSLKLGDTGTLANAAGSLNSGNTIRAVSNYNQQGANQAFGSYLQPLSGMVGQGYNAANTQGQLGVNQANEQGQIRAQIGQVQQAGSLGAGLDSLSSDLIKGAGMAFGGGFGGGASSFGGGGGGNFLSGIFGGGGNYNGGGQSIYGGRASYG